MKMCVRKVKGVICVKKKSILALAMTGALSLSLLTGCVDSSKGLELTEVEYDVQEAIAPYLDNLDPIPEEDKDFVIEMGYNDCDHMCASIIGEGTGLYEALGLNVNVTKSGQTHTLLAAGDMQVGYCGLGSAILNFNKGARLIMPAGSHLGGAMYAVVAPDVESLDEVVGGKIDQGESATTGTFWREVCDKLAIPLDIAQYYQGTSMSDTDGMLALKAGEIDIFTCCDPYASMAEEEGFGKIIATTWHADVQEDKSTGFGIHCGYYLNADFVDQHPALAQRLVLAHCLGIQYMYLHPYSAGEMFAKGFGTSVGVGLRTMYLKTVAEGRTMCYTLTEENMQNYEDWYDLMGVPEEDRTLCTQVDGFLDFSLQEKIGIETFQEFIENNGIDEREPIGMDYADWLYMAETIDGIDHESPDGKVEKWMEEGNQTESEIAPYTGENVFVAPMHATEG